jgi:hypothetical protein
VARADGALPHPHLDDCAIEVVAEVQTVDDLLRAPAHEFEVAVVGATRAQIADPGFATRLLRLARTTPTVLVPTSVTRASAALAARTRTRGLAGAGCEAAELARTVRAVAHGRIAYPIDAIALILPLVEAACGAKPDASVRAATTRPAGGSPPSYALSSMSSTSPAA